MRARRASRAVAAPRLIAALLGLAACLPTSRTGSAGPSAPEPAAAQVAAARATATPAAARAGTGRTSTPAGSRTPAPAGGAAKSAGGSASAADACPAPGEIVRRLQARYDETRAFRADFRQATTIAAMGESEEASGTVAFKKPGKMRWEFARPERQSIISDGKTLWVYQPAERQVLKAPFNAAFVSTTPVSFLTGVGRIADDFDAEADRRGCDAARIRVRLVPKSTPDLGSLTVAVTRPEYDIVEAEVTDPIGNVTTLTFAAVARNVDIPDEEFRFVTPAGVDVVEAPGGALGGP